MLDVCGVMFALYGMFIIVLWVGVLCRMLYRWLIRFLGYCYFPGSLLLLIRIVLFAV